MIQFSCAFASKLPARAAVIWKLDWGRRIHIQDGLLKWLLAKALFPVCWTAWVTSWYDSWLPQWEIQEKEQGESYILFYWPSCEITYHNFSFLSFITIKSSKAAHTWEPFPDLRNIKVLVNIFKYQQSKQKGRGGREVWDHRGRRAGCLMKICEFV